MSQGVGETVFSQPVHTCFIHSPCPSVAAGSVSQLVGQLPCQSARSSGVGQLVHSLPARTQRCLSVTAAVGRAGRWPVGRAARGRSTPLHRARSAKGTQTWGEVGGSAAIIVRETSQGSGKWKVEKAVIDRPPCLLPTYLSISEVPAAAKARFPEAGMGGGGRWSVNCSSQSWALLVSHPCSDLRT